MKTAKTGLATIGGVVAVVATLAVSRADAPATAFVGVAVVIGDPPRVVHDRTVLVDRGRIVKLGPSRQVQVPDGATVVEGKGKYLMPGLGDMHGHVWREGWPETNAQLATKLFLASGITTVREMWGTPAQIALRDQIARGEQLGPRLFVYGPALRRETTPTPEAAIQQVEAQKQAGFDGLKINEGLSAATYQAIVRTARRLRLPFAGHVPNAVGLERALAAGQKSIEHLDGYIEALAGDDLAGERFDGDNPPPSEMSIFLVLKPALLERVDEKRITRLVAATRRAGATNIPTLALTRTLFNADEVASLRQLPELKYWPPALVNRWITQQSQQKPRPEADLAKVIGLQGRLIEALADAGAPVALGSDAQARFCVPGFSLAREAEALVKAGLTPAQVVRAGTIEVARYLGLEKQWGTIGVGKRADLILADGNPLEDVANAFRASGVMVNGRWLPRAELDAMLADIERSLHFPGESELKDLPVAGQEGAVLSGDYAFPAPASTTVSVWLDKGALRASNDRKSGQSMRLRAQGDGTYFIPEETMKITFEVQGGRAAAMRVTSPGYLDWRAPRVR